MTVAIFLDGPIGAGKTTLGRLLAQRLSAGFVDGDHHHVPGRSWFGSSLTTSRRILEASQISRNVHGIVVIAYPLRCLNWLYFEKHSIYNGVDTVFVSIGASYEEITSPSRGRHFDEAERRRVLEMIAQGYGARSFCDLQITTGGRGIAATLDELEAGVRRLMPPPGC